MVQTLVPVNSTPVEALLAEAGFDVNDPNLYPEVEGLDIPRVRIEHRKNGKHRVFIDRGENYLDPSTQEETLPDESFTAIVFAEQFIRALWNDNDPRPMCSSVNGVIRRNSDQIIATSCLHCPEAVIGQGHCKPKVRLWLLKKTDTGEYQVLVFNLSPTSIKHWNLHKRKLQRSNLPVVAVETRFTLSDTKKNGFRWAEVTVDAIGIAQKEDLIVARDAQLEFKRLMDDISAGDFSDPGDKAA
jgi:hypothetical protein